MGQVDRKSTAGRVERAGKMVREDKYSWMVEAGVCVGGGGGRYIRRMEGQSNEVA